MRTAPIKMGIHKLNQRKKNPFSDRIVVVSTAIVIAFSLLVLQFYNIQIIDHDKYEQDLIASVQREVEVPAVRGNIYDRYGKPLAVNKPVYVLKIDPQVTMDKKQLNQVILKAVNLLEENDDEYIDVMPISKTAPFTYTDESSVRSFITNYVPYDDKEHRDELVQKSADELMAYLRGKDVFNLDSSISDEDARKIVAIRLLMYQTTYQKYKKITIATNISMKTLAAIEENQTQYPSIMAEVDSQRSYTYPKELGNILGYTRTITASQYESLADKGYDKDDIIGQAGVESTMEDELRGKKGTKQIEVDNVGRTVFTSDTTDAVAGNDVYLTIDADLQVAAYHAMEKRLSEALVERLTGGSNRNVIPLTGREVIVSMAENNQLDFDEMAEAAEGTASKSLYDKVKASYDVAVKNLEEAEKDLKDEDKTKLTLKEHFKTLLEEDNSPITNQELLLAFVEHGSLPVDEATVQNIKAGNYNLEALIVQSLQSGILKPDQMSVQPFSGAAVVVDVNTGDILSIVGYPSYDGNEMIENFNSYYTDLHDGIDARNLLWNRALRTAKAPGSTFKMITGIAGLEEGVINEYTVISDTGQYTKVGEPYPRCWIYTNNGYGHGIVTLKRALEVSCNFFFYEVGYLLSAKYGGPYGGIDALTKYVEMFGLNQKTGAELEESAPNVSSPLSIVDTNISRALNKLKNMDKDTETALKTDSKSYVDSGFYPYVDSEPENIEIEMQYLTQDEIRKLLNTELGFALSEDLNDLIDRMLKDYAECYKDGVNAFADELAPQVLADKGESSLKSATIDAIRNLLMGQLQKSTEKALLKTIEKMPSGLVYEAYLSAYTNAYNNAIQDGKSQAIVDALKERMEAIENGTYDTKAALAAKIKERILNIYLDTFFKNTQITWTNAVNVRTAIGQGDNTFTPLQMARYIAGLANGKTVYDLRVVNGISNNKTGEGYVEKPLKVYNTLELKESTLQLVKEGMHLVTHGTEGTAAKYFSDCKIDVAAKTGTAEEVKEHSWFVSFAPYDNPQIAVVTTLYDADGLGSYDYKLARDIIETYFNVTDDEVKQESTNTHLVE